MSEARAVVVIPNWNGAGLLPTCLKSLENQGWREFEVLVVDNASTDDSRGVVEAQAQGAEFPRVRWLGLDRNRYFAGAVNAGVRATAHELVVLLNNDTEAEATWLEELVGALDGNARAGMAASKLRLFDERNKLHSAGDFFRVDGVPGNRGVWEEDRGQYDDPNAPPRLFGACGGACVYRRAMLDEIGLLDEDLEFNCEDVDLNWRARLAGFECVFAPRAVVYHKLSATGGGALASFFTGRNFLAVLAKNYPGGLWRKHRREIVGAQLGITWDALRNVRGAAARARLKGQWAGVMELGRYRAKRAAVKRLTRVSEGDVEGWLAR